MDIRSIGQWLLPLAMLASLVPIGAALFRTRPLDRPSRVITAAVFVSLIFNELSMQVVYYRASEVAFHGNPSPQLTTFPLMHLYLVAQSILLGWFYTIAFADSPSLVRTVRLLGGVVFAYTLVNALPLADWLDGWNRPASRSLAVQSFFFILLAMTYLYRLFARSELVSLEGTPLFWFNAGIFIYFSLSFFAFIYWRILPMESRLWSSLIHQCAAMVLNVFYTLGFLCKLPTSKM